MKKEINAALIMVSFPILYVGGTVGNAAIALIGIVLLVLNACIIVFQKKTSKAKKTEKDA